MSSVLQCVAVRCSALQCVAVRCSALQCVAVRCSVLQCDESITPLPSTCTHGSCVRVAVRCSVLQCVAVCCSVINPSLLSPQHAHMAHVCVWKVCCSTLQCAAVRCSVLQCDESITPPSTCTHASCVRVKGSDGSLRVHV